MKRTREQMKAEWMKKAEQEFDRLLDWEARTDRPTLTQFEDQVLVSREVLSEALLEEMMGGQEAQQPAEAVRCPRCGEEMEHKGRQTKVVETRVGALQLSRHYYYCTRCKAGLFPPG